MLKCFFYQRYFYLNLIIKGNKTISIIIGLFTKKKLASVSFYFCCSWENRNLKLRLVPPIGAKKED